ncbi:cilia- and flagella-associated protein 45 [Aethina tumida]|uniref:cilia- and flagella-associated protein 45 n=1 Tax=Aethina tumida TaxID=116153 RepID=UPI00096B0FDC|nr:cilia- and flagella-associated protein 45 [Aethina tumida]
MATPGKFSRGKKTSVAIPPDHSIKLCPHRLNHKPIHQKIRNVRNGKELVEIHEQKMNRVLVVPSRKPATDITGIWPSSEFTRLKKQAHVITAEDRIAMHEEALRTKAAMEAESAARKEKLASSFVKLDSLARGSKLDEAEAEAKAKNEGLVRRSYELMIEEDERVRDANRLILARKCHFIRNAQIAEKELIKKELQEEDRRLDMMMEQYRQIQQEAEVQKSKEEELRKQKVLEEVRLQLKEIEVNKLVEAEKREEECKIMNKLIASLHKQEEEEEQNRREKQIKMRDAYTKSFNENLHHKRVQEEELRISDMRIAEFLRKKNEREEALEREKQEQRLAREKEQARMGAEQKKEADKQANLDALNALKTIEDKEREWREKELADALRHRQQIIDLRKAREKQIDDIRKLQAMSIAKEEEHFKKNRELQKKQLEKEQNDMVKRKEETQRFHHELLMQINEKEKAKIKAFEDKFEEGKAMRLENEGRDRQIEEYIRYKVQKLKECNLPAAYIQDIQNQLRLN